MQNVINFFSSKQNLIKCFLGCSTYLLFLSIAGKLFPAYKKWTDEFLVENFGELEVKLEHKTEKGKTPVGERGVGRDTIKSFLETYKEKSSYIVSQLPDPMAEDVYVPPFMMCGTIYDRLLESNLWLSAGGTKSLLHKDADHAINCLLNGTKDWILIDPKQEANVCIKGSILDNRNIANHVFYCSCILYIFVEIKLL